MDSRRVIVLGASENPGRYSYRAVNMLQRHGHEVIAIGKQAGTVNGIEIQTGRPEVSGIHTATLYLAPQNQSGLADYLSKTGVKRVIFNPGTENPALEKALSEEGVEVLEACTLVMLSTGQF